MCIRDRTGTGQLRPDHFYYPFLQAYLLTHPQPVGSGFVINVNSSRQALSLNLQSRNFPRNCEMRNASSNRTANSTGIKKYEAAEEGRQDRAQTSGTSQ